jgi:LPS export ABC transporter protein LptC
MINMVMKIIGQHKKTVAALIMGCIFLFACENEKVENKPVTKTTGVEEAKNIVLNYTLGGNTKAVLRAPLMFRVQDTAPYLEFPKTLHVDFYDEDGKPESKLRALYAKYKESQNLVYIRDSVNVINMEKGDTLDCDELYWDRRRTGIEFYTDKPVRIRTKTQIINGVGMESGQNFKNWHIKRPTGTILVPSSKFPG